MLTLLRLHKVAAIEDSMAVFSGLCEIADVEQPAPMSQLASLLFCIAFPHYFHRARVAC